MATTAAAKSPAEIAPAAPKKSKLLLIIIVAVVLAALGAGAGWYFLTRADAADEDEAAPSKPAVFLPVDQFTVNLQSEDGQQFLQVAMTLKVVDTDTVEAIKALLPEVRSRILLLLSSKKASQLSSPEGKAGLSEEIIAQVEASLPTGKHRQKAKKQAKAGAEEIKPGKKAKAKSQPEPEEVERAAPHRVLAVYFTHFIIQ
ncbi:MAG: flagellar basal body-associated protein FliL [Betaproteobacteria bacterium]|nr:MAG: flagellar basal body-associated protein FliL [Betaproteobacteria bacterium]